MALSIALIGSGPACGKSVAALGIIDSALRAGKRVAVLRPIIVESPPGDKDHDLSLIEARFSVLGDYEKSYVWTVPQAKRLLVSDQDRFFGAIIARHEELVKDHDVVISLGADFSPDDDTFEHIVNIRVAAALGAAGVYVLSAHGRQGAELADSLKLTQAAFAAWGLPLRALIVGRADPADPSSAREAAAALDGGSTPYSAVIPEDDRLAWPTMDELRGHLDAEVVRGQERLDEQVRDFIIGAMPLEAFLERMVPGACVITPGDRSDIILGTIAASMTPDHPKPAGLVLTGGMRPAHALARLFAGVKAFPISILSTPLTTYPAAKMLTAYRTRINPTDTAKAKAALEIFANNVDAKALWEALESGPRGRLTPELFEYSLFAKARAARARIVLPEGVEDRILKAAAEARAQGVAEIILLGDKAAINSKIAALGLDLAGVEIRDPACDPALDDYAATLFELRKQKGLTQEDAAAKVRDKTYFGTMMVHKGEAGGMVSGSTTTTAETIRPALEFVKTKPGISIVSGVFFMCLRDRVLVYGDCAVNPNPTAEQLAQIAVCSAGTARAFGIDPKVAMLSYSTGGSGKGADVDKVREATALAKSLAPDLPLEGPLQYDAAADPVVAAEKLPGSKVAGQATVFIFPDLDTGNNTYKAVQRSSGAVAMGPVLQGLNKPVNDLSRGCTVKDIVYTIAITAIQAGGS